ncbi:MAG: SDR family NAD(P)-dependent oxidoreductase, partial [Anaerolineae bacterium]|nr:SDR family NAD(P)-dependent oxidoreductase [Anaerolineae bacterium]
IDLTDSPFYLVTETQAWPRLVNEAGQPIPRRAGVSSFGFGGAYAHVVLEEYQEQGSGVRGQESGAGPQVMVLSARNEDRLRAYAHNLLTFLEKVPSQQSVEQEFTGAEQTPAIEEAVRVIISEMMGVAPDDIEVEQPFEEYGFDPVQLSHLKTMVEAQYHNELPLTLFSGQASVAHIAQYLASLAGESDAKSQTPPALSLPSLAYTLQMGREAMASRLALVVTDLTDLRQKLKVFLAGKAEVEWGYLGQVIQDARPRPLLSDDDDMRELVMRWMSHGKLEKLAQLWVSGVEIEWNALYGVDKPRRISLPTYPFAKERYWIPNVERGIMNDEKNPSSFIHHHSSFALHPLVHRNISDLVEQRFSSTFTGTEFFLNDHRIQDEKILPGVAYLEMARAAGEIALRDQAVTQLKDVVWSRPLVVNDEMVEVQLGLYPDERGEVAFEVSHHGTLYSQGKLVVGKMRPPKPLDIAAIQNRCSSMIESADCYRFFREHGFAYGPAFQGVVQLRYNSAEALAQLRLPAEVISDAYGLHPSLLDASLHAIVGLGLGRQSNDRLQSVYLPFAVETVNIYESPSEQGYAYVRFSSGVEPTGDVVKYDIVLTNEQGAVCVVFKGLTVRAIAEPAKTDIFFATSNWQIKALDKSGDDPRQMPADNTLLLLGFEPGVVRSLATTFDQVTVQALPDPQSDTAEMVTTNVRQVWSQLKAKLNTLPSNAPCHILLVVTDTVESHLYTPLTGLLQTAHLEHPHIRGKVITVADPELSRLTALLSREMRSDSFQAVDVRYDEQGTRTIKMLQASELEVSRPAKRAYLKSGSVYWITGGLGGLGRLFARHLLEEDNITVVLSGRSALDEVGRQQLADLNRGGGTVVYLPVDVSRRDDVERVVQTIHEKFGPLNGIVHSAGLMRDSFIINKTEAEIAMVLAPKVAGALNIDVATRTEPLDFMVLFSSIVGVIGNVGQADYATANAFLDVFAHHRQALVEAGKRSGRTLSLNWSLWAEGGMTVDSKTAAWLKHEMGLTTLATSAGLAAFEVALAQEQLTQLLVLSGDRPKISAYLRGVGRDRRVKRSRSVDLPHVEPDHLVQASENYLKTVLAQTLKLPTARLDSKASWETYGIESTMTLELTRKLEQRFGELPKTLFFEYPTLTELAAYFVEHYPTHLQETAERVADTTEKAPQSSPLPAPASAPTSPRKRWLRSQAGAVGPHTISHDVEAIAIIGLSGRYPMADTLVEFWKNLKAGRNCITEIPAERWDYRPYYDPTQERAGTSHSKWGGFITDVDKFDPLFFNISPREAERIDPQERLFLETVWSTVEDAGYSRTTLAQIRQVGVFVGVMYHHYPFLAADPTVAATLGAASYWQIANRVSYFFDWQGPSLAIDTACSSSLTAIHMACESIKRGECRLAVAGGVNLSLHPAKWLSLSHMQIIGSEGQSKSLGTGDGYVPGEGVGAVLLKPLEQAVADNDQIYAVIKGGSLNHGGKTSGFTVPNPNAQADLIRQTFEKTGVDPETLSYIEVASNGSTLGDPIEIAGLTKAFQASTKMNSYRCPIGAVKSNIGHLEAASGISQLTKVVLQLKNQTLVPSINANPVNPHLNLERTPFYIQEKVDLWPRPEIEQDGERLEVPRRAAISSFGAGGANTHLVIEEYQGAGVGGREQGVGNGQSQLIVLSAKNEERLRVYATKLLQFLEQSADVSLDEMAYTLQVGREAMAERLAFVARDNDEVRQRLNAYLENTNVNGGQLGLFRGRVEQSKAETQVLVNGRVGQEMIRRGLADREWETLAVLWTKGGEIPWEQLYEPDRPRRISLPTYPFKRQRYWLADSDVGRNGLQNAASFRLESDNMTIPFEVDAAKTNRENIQYYLVKLLARLFNIPVVDLKPDKSLYDYGLDSIIGMQLRRQLEETFETEITGRELLEYDQIQTLAEHLATKIEFTGPSQQPVSKDSINKTNLLTRAKARAALEKFKTGDMSLEEIKSIF